jgi:SAM-dependent methyltransferase
MELHPLAQGFADVADDYERGRPGYSRAAIAAFGLQPGARVADVGAGTGKLTRALVDFGFDVVAIEPLDGMRARLARELPAVQALAGTAEALPLGDASLDGVACGDAFHWFDVERSAVELARVIRPGGVLAVLGNRPGGSMDGGWERELGALLAEARPHHPGLDDDGSRHAAFDATGLFTPLAASAFPNPYRTDREGLLANIASMSYVAIREPDAKAQLLARADAILRAHGIEELDGELSTMLWTARRVA